MKDLVQVPMALLIGCMIGFFFGMIRESRGFGLIGNVVIGAAGAVAGEWAAGKFDLPPGGLVGSFIGGAAGAFILLVFLGRNR